MKATRLFLGGVVFLISGIALIVYAYSNVLPEISEYTVPATPIRIVDTVLITDSTQHAEEQFLCSVYFSSGSSSLSDKEQWKLGNSLETLSAQDSITFRIDGFADPTGAGSVDNNRIALARSFSVYSFLRQRGIAKDNLLMRSFGAPQNAHSVIDSLRKADIIVIGGIH